MSCHRAATEIADTYTVVLSQSRPRPPLELALELAPRAGPRAGPYAVVLSQSRPRPPLELALELPPRAGPRAGPYAVVLSQSRPRLALGEEEVNAHTTITIDMSLILLHMCPHTSMCDLFWHFVYV
jgi:hypothetical protein